MKILAFSDLHDNPINFEKLKKKITREKPDLVICAGDFTNFEHKIKSIIDERISRLHKKIFLVHGNHESESRVRELCVRYKNIAFIHKKVLKHNDYLIIGYGGEGFSSRSRGFESFAMRIKNKVKNNKVILVTHAPPQNTVLDKLDGYHGGNLSIRKFIDNNNVRLAISGHFHETAGKRQHIGNTLLINPGPYGSVIRL